MLLDGKSKLRCALLLSDRAKGANRAFELEEGLAFPAPKTWASSLDSATWRMASSGCCGLTGHFRLKEFTVTEMTLLNMTNLNTMLGAESRNKNVLGSQTGVEQFQMQTD